MIHHSPTFVGYCIVMVAIKVVVKRSLNEVMNFGVFTVSENSVDKVSKVKGQLLIT